ncbi:MAG: single-stranded DNA-binding protein [Deltaproteobacteria bacterium]|nr:single-stranded DNA-binding protein [Deltaproteobacteria bacterium]
MPGLNKVMLIGNLGRDPETRFTQKGTAVAIINLAVSEPRKIDGQWEEHTEWMRVKCFARTAENVGEYLKKGSQIHVEGRMATSKYQDKDGKDKWSTEVITNSVIFLGSKKTADIPPNAPDAGTVLGDSQDDGFYDDELPI